MKTLHFFLIMLLFFTSCQLERSKEKIINVAVAANMQIAMDEVAEAFKKKYNIRVEISSSSSGILTTQIKQGAPFDVFISANMRYPNLLYDEGLAVNKPKAYAYGTLVLWTLKDINIDNQLYSLLNDSISRFAVANPEIAPYGIAAFEALKDSELLDSLKNKMIMGESIGQVNQYVMSKSVDAGLTSKSILFSKHIKNKGISVEINKVHYTPIKQGIVILKHGKGKHYKNVKLFYDFMFTKEVKNILTTFGYDVSRRHN